MTAKLKTDYSAFTDVELAARIGAGDAAAVRWVTGQNNQRLFRVAWSILGNRAESEDAVQSAYLRAFAAIERFRGSATLTTWLTRITINEALGRRRRAKRRQFAAGSGSVVVMEEYRDKLMRGSLYGSAPDRAVARDQIRALLEQAIARLPSPFRLVFVLREVEGLSVAATAEALDIPPATVKTRHLRARRRLQRELDPELHNALVGTFPFAGADCEALTNRVVRAFAGTGTARDDG
ncbi:MAG TPA: RNA polymerase sigma factor [Sphingomonadaceae bacterium]|nr:RNA polymerase sigma factor [Sphingomonadaceae bacterium]